MKTEGWILSVPKDQRLAAIRAHNMARGKTLPILEVCPCGVVHEAEAWAQRWKQDSDFSLLLKSYQHPDRRISTGLSFNLEPDLGSPYFGRFGRNEVKEWTSGKF